MCMCVIVSIPCCGIRGHLATREFRYQPARHQPTPGAPNELFSQKMIYIHYNDNTTQFMFFSLFFFVAGKKICSALPARRLNQFQLPARQRGQFHIPVKVCIWVANSHIEESRPLPLRKPLCHNIQPCFRWLLALLFSSSSVMSCKTGSILTPLHSCEAFRLPSVHYGVGLQNHSFCIS